MSMMHLYSTESGRNEMYLYGLCAGVERGKLRVGRVRNIKE